MADLEPFVAPAKPLCLGCLLVSFQPRRVTPVTFVHCYGLERIPFFMEAKRARLDRNSLVFFLPVPPQDPPTTAAYFVERLLGSFCPRLIALSRGGLYEFGGGLRISEFLDEVASLCNLTFNTKNKHFFKLSCQVALGDGASASICCNPSLKPGPGQNWLSDSCRIRSIFSYRGVGRTSVSVVWVSLEPTVDSIETGPRRTR